MIVLMYVHIITCKGLFSALITWKMENLTRVRKFPVPASSLFYMACHTCMVRSLLAEATFVPSGDQATVVT